MYSRSTNRQKFYVNKSNINNAKKQLNILGNNDKSINLSLKWKLFFFWINIQTYLSFFYFLISEIWEWWWEEDERYNILTRHCIYYSRTAAAAVNANACKRYKKKATKTTTWIIKIPWVKYPSKRLINRTISGHYYYLLLRSRSLQTSRIYFIFFFSSIKTIDT